MKALQFKTPAWLLVTICSIFLQLGCKKNFSEKNEAQTDKELIAIKQEFQTQEVQKWLTKPFKNNLDLQWTPQWQGLRKKLEKDSVECTYIPLKAELRDKINGQITKANTLAIQKYLLVTNNKTGYSFQEATYIYENVPDPGKGTSLSINSINTNVVVRDFKTNKLTFYNPQASNSSAQRPQDCQIMFYCEYYTGCTQIYIITATTSYGSCKCPTQTFPNCSDNTGCDGGQWYYLYGSSTEVCVPDPNDPQIPDTRYIYARLEQTNENYDSYTDNVGTYHEFTKRDTYIRFYKDKDCTIPSGVDPSVIFNYFAYFQWISSAQYGQSHGSWYYTTSAPDNITTSVYLGNLITYHKLQYSDPNFGTVTEETYFSHKLQVGNNYDYYYLPTIFY